MLEKIFSVIKEGSGNQETPTKKNINDPRPKKHMGTLEENTKTKY